MLSIIGVHACIMVNVLQVDNFNFTKVSQWYIVVYCKIYSTLHYVHVGGYPGQAPPTGGYPAPGGYPQQQPPAAGGYGQPPPAGGYGQPPPQQGYQQPPPS